MADALCKVNDCDLGDLLQERSDLQNFQDSDAAMIVGERGFHEFGVADVAIGILIVAIEELSSGAIIVNNDRLSSLVNRNCIGDFNHFDRSASVLVEFAKLSIKIFDEFFFGRGVRPSTFAAQSKNAECLYLA